MSNETQPKKENRATGQASLEDQTTQHSSDEHRQAPTGHDYATDLAESANRHCYDR